MSIPPTIITQSEQWNPTLQSGHPRAEKCPDYWARKHTNTIFGTTKGVLIILLKCPLFRGVLIVLLKCPLFRGVLIVLLKCPLFRGVLIILLKCPHFRGVLIEWFQKAVRLYMLTPSIIPTIVTHTFHIAFFDAHPLHVIDVLWNVRTSLCNLHMLVFSLPCLLK